MSCTELPSSSGSPARIYIVGAGFAGRMIAREIRSKGTFGEVVAFLDDDRSKIGLKIDGVPVLGPIADVVRLIKTLPADEALIAIPGASREQLATIYRLLRKAEFAKIRILPAISQIVEGDAHLIQTREIDPQDLLGRNPVQISLKESLAYLRGKRVLVTGAGGSIGSELSRQLLSGGAERLYLFGHGENSIYEIDRELRLLQEEGVGEKATIVPIIGELADRDYMQFILKRLKADVVFHCAAYKHVPMVEENPVQAVKNNIFGTLNLVHAAKQAEVKRFVLISTDKAVEPECVYGMTKLISEEIVLAAGLDAEHGGSDRRSGGEEYMVVRFGNVLGSRGSIMPLFRKQIMKGGPVTITDPNASRFFMTIPEAASLVLKAGGVGRNGTLYLLDMGEPILIRDLAEHMIRFYGYEPEREIPIVTIGMRPGEKLHEKLHADSEVPVPTEYPRINRIENRSVDTGRLSALLSELEPICFFHPEREDRYRNRRLLRSLLKEYVSTVRIPAYEPEY
jgi:FlaA1/EpsC-like NDP-sugar epimerase